MGATKELIHEIEMLAYELTDKLNVDVDLPTVAAIHLKKVERLLVAAKAQQSKTVRVWVANDAVVLSGNPKHNMHSIWPDKPTDIEGQWELEGYDALCHIVIRPVLEALGLPRSERGECHQYEITTTRIDG